MLSVLLGVYLRVDELYGNSEKLTNSYFTLPSIMHNVSNTSKSWPILVIFLFFFFVNSYPNEYELVYMDFYIRLLIKMDTDD